MSESLRGDVERARQFLETHVYALPANLDEYSTQQHKEWGEDAEVALNRGEKIKPMWLSNRDSTDEFSAHVNGYCPRGDAWEWRVAIDISTEGQSEVEVWLPKDDGSGEPVVAFSEAFTLESLDRAIRFAEESVQPHN